MKPEALWWISALLMLADVKASDYGEEKKGKVGYCPAFPNGLYRPPCTVECEGDSECAGALKCCNFACRYSCTPPSRDKPGFCPSPLMKKLDVPALCATACATDDDCTGARKCCQTTCGRTCRLPLSEKPGKCPKKQPQKNLGSSADTCLHDQECSGTEKCCFTGSSMNCLQVPPESSAGTEDSHPSPEAVHAPGGALAGRGVDQQPRKHQPSLACKRK